MPKPPVWVEIWRGTDRQIYEQIRDHLMLETTLSCMFAQDPPEGGPGAQTVISVLEQDLTEGQEIVEEIRKK